MKKMLFGLIATVMLSISGNAQEVELTNENIREEMVKGMVSFTKNLKPAFESTKDFKSFKILLCGKYASGVPSEGNQLLDKAYNYIAKGISDEEILESDSGKEMAQAILYIKNHSPKSTFNSEVVFGGSIGSFNSQTSSERCAWYALSCHLNNIFGPKAGAVITDAIGWLIEQWLHSITK